MSATPRVVFARAVASDAGKILTVQRAAFVQEAQSYGEPNVPPLVETLDEVRAVIADSRVVVGRIGPRLVAAGRLNVRDRIGHVGRLAVVPDLQGQGIGRALLAAVEAAGAGDVDEYRLFTGYRTLGNLHLYRSAGYHDTHTERITDTFSFVHLRKRLGGSDVTDGRSLAGDWRLLRWVAEGDDGTIVMPFGKAPQGILVYSPEGTMITTIAPAERPPISSTDPLRGGPDAQRMRTAETFIAYSGRYAFDGRDVTHTVEMSLYPNWVGTRQVRHVQLSEDGNTLELSTEPFTLAGRRSVQRLTWIRVRPGD